MATKKPYTAQPTTTLNYDALMANLNALPGEAAAEEKPSVARRIGDTAVQFGQGAVTGVKMMSDIFGVNNPVSSGLSDVNQALDGLLSATAQGDKQKVAQIMQEAEGKGWGEQVIAGLKAAGVDPVGLAANALGTSLPTMATMLIPGAGPAAVAARMGAGVAMGAGQGVGAVKGQIYDETKRKWLEARATPEQAEAKAQEAAAYGGENTDQMAIGGVLGMGSVLGAERALGKVLHGASKAGPGMLGRVATSTLAETGTEMLQGGQEKFATNTALNRQGFDVDPMSGVIANATLEGVAAAPMGAIAGIPKPAVATAPGIDPAQEAADTIRATEKVPESGALTRAVNAGTEAKAQAVEAGAPVTTQPGAEQTDEAAPEAVDDPVRDQILALPDGARQDALRAYAVVNRTDVAKGVQQYNRKLLDRLLAENAPPPVLGERLTDTDMGAMLGGGGMAGRADPLAGALGMNNEAQANSITNVANVAERRPPMPASDAARMLDEARNRGLDLAVAEHPAGGFVLVPPNWVTPDMAAQGEARLNETISRMQQADAAPVERAPRTRTDGVGLNLQTDPVQNYLDNLRSVNTPAARAYVRDFDAGRITPADVQRRMVVEQGVTPDQRIARAAAEAPATADPVADRLRQAVSQRATPAPTDILNPAGEPFKTRMAADRAAKKTPGAVVPVEGGFVVRPQEPVNVQDAAQGADVTLTNEGDIPEAAPVEALAPVAEQPAGPAAGVPAEGVGAVEAAGVSVQLEDALFKERDATASAIENDWMNGNGRRRLTNIERAIYDAVTASTLDADSAAQIIETALENDRPDLAQYAASRAMRAAKSMDTTPGVPQSSPKYGKIKSDLEASKKQALDAASALQEIVNSKQAPQAVAGVVDATPATAPPIVEVQDNYGRTHRVRQSDLYSNADRIPTVRQNGEVVAGEEIPRSIVKDAPTVAEPPPLDPLGWDPKKLASTYDMAQMQDMYQYLLRNYSNPVVGGGPVENGKATTERFNAEGREIHKALQQAQTAIYERSKAQRGSSNQNQAETPVEQAPEAAKSVALAGDADAIAALIQQSIAENSIKANEKIAREQVAKGYLTQEQADADLQRIREGFANTKPNQWAQALAKAIAEKDPRPLVGAWAKEGQGTYGVEGSMAGFEKATGVKLRRLNSAARAKAIFDWAGWTEGQVAADVAERRKLKAESDAASEAKWQAEYDDRITERATKELVLFKDTQQKRPIKESVDDLIAQGYNTIRTLKRGAITKTYLANERGEGYPLPVGVMRDYAQAAVRRAAAPNSGVEPANTGVEAPAQETTHNGTRIYPTKIKVGDEVKSMWAVESPDNQRRRAAGERTIGGDSLHDSIEQAKAAAEREAKRDAEQRAAKAEQDAADKARLDAEEARKAANRPKTVVERRKDAILDGPSKIGQGTKRAVIATAVDNGYAIEAKMVYDYAAKKRDQEAVDRASRAGYILGVSNENLPLVKAGNEAKARLKEGKYEKPEYRVYQGSDTKAPFREITKTEYDYAQELKAQRAAAPQPEAAQPATPQQDGNDFLPEGWTKSVNGYTKRPVYRMEQGVGQPFAVVTQTEGMTYEVQIRHGDKQLTTGTQRGALSEVLAAAEAELGRMKQADSVTHADPGEKAEAATPAVVADSLKKAARNEDTKPSEMRKWLVAEIDKELLQAPDRADYDEAVKRLGEKDAISGYTGNGPLGKNNETGYVTFDVPGDGRYKVRNSVRGLLEFRKNVMASQGFKDSGQKRVKPEQNDGVQGGSGGNMAAITNMVEEGDFEAARDYAEAVGINLGDVKVPKGDNKPAWEKYLKDGMLPPVPDTKPQPAPKTAAQLDEEKRQAAEAEAKRPKDTGWNMAGTGYGGKRYIGRNITLDDGREVVARVYENAGNYEEAEVKVDGVRKFTVTDRDTAQDKADAFIKSLTEPAVESVATDMAPEDAAKYLKDFAYSLDQLEGMTDRAQVSLSSPLGKSGRDTLLMEAFGLTRDEAHDINNRLDARQPKKLRNIDMQDAFAVFPSLRKMVDDAIGLAKRGQDASGTRRDPAKVSMFAPYEDGDIVAINGQDWTVKQDTPGWYLTTTGNWRGQHPTIRNIKAMADLIREVEQASVAQKAAAPQADTPKLTPAEAKSLMEWQDLGQKDGVKTHALTFYESQADKDAKRGRMIVAKVSKGDRSATAWMVDGDDQTFGALSLAKKRAEEVGMARAVADGFVEATAAKATANDRNAFTLQRLNRETGQMEPVTFERGEYVRYTVGGRDQFGDIDGISQARKEFSVGGLWHPFGFAYKAERPAAPKAGTVPLSSVIDKVNAKNGQGLTDADRVPEQKTASKTPLIDRHTAVMDAVRGGRSTPESFKDSFEAVVSGADAIKAELKGKTKDELLAGGGPYFQARYKNESKPSIIDGVYRAMLDEYTLGQAFSYGMGAYEKTVRRLVEATDADKLAQFVKEREAALEESKTRREATAKAMENPQTLDDFRALMRAKATAGMGQREAFLSLTPEQRIRYDDLAAESTRATREANKQAQKTQVQAAGQTTGGEIIETKHTRDGYDLFVVKLADRLSKEDYSTVLASAKKLGGWYSAFRGNGAIPGFQFKDKANAEAFLALAGGDTAAAQEQVAQRRDAFEDDRSQTAVERLRAMADKLEEGAAEVEGQQRKTNTARRARFASAAMASAAADKAKAQTMRNIAQAIEDGNAKFLDAVRTKSQVDMLTGIVDTAKGAELRAKYPSYADQQKRKGEPPTAETADFAEFPSYSAFRSDLATLGRQMLEVDGTKKLGQRLMSVADDVTDAYLEFAKANFQDVSRFGRGDSLADFASKDEAERAIKRSGLTGKAIVLPIKRGQNRVILSPSEAIGRGLWQGDGDKRITLTAEFGAELVEAIGRRGNKQNKLSVPWQFQNAYDRRKALSRIGIETPSEFRAALREFISLKEQAIANRTRELELQMVGRKADGLDFFPTSAEVADQMIEAADLTPDMAVLEPSAGMGHLADRIREAGAEPDVIEISADRRELLEEKGYHLAVVDDFMQMEPRKFFTYGDVFRAPDGVEGTMRGVGRMGSQRVRLEDAEGNRLGLYDRDELVGVRHMGTWSGYDRIIMNPPFSNRRDAEHVRHAYSLLKPGGRIVAIMGEGVFFGQDKKAQDFREWLESVGGTSEKLPEGSFMDPSLPVNTSVNARMVVIDKPASAPVFSRDSGSVPQSPAEWLTDTVIADEVEKRIGSFAQQPPIRIRDTAFGQLPGVARNDNVAGAVHDGAIYLFRDQLGDRAAVQRTLFHELFHYGLRKFLTKAQFTEQMMRLYSRDKSIKDEADRWASRADGLRAERFGGREYALARGVDEALAILAEPNGGAYLNKTPRAIFIRRLTGWLADVAEFLKMDKAAAYLRSIKNEEAREYIQSIFKRLETDEGGNATDWSEASEPAFSRTTEAAKAVGDAIKSVTVTNIKQRAGFKLTDYLGIGLQALGRRQIVDIYGDMIPLGEYNRLVQQMEADKNEGGAEADQLVTRWAKLEDEGKLADLMHDATLAQIDPAEDFVEGDDKGKYLELQRKYNLLSDEAKKVYADTRDSYKAHHAKVRSAIKERIERSEIKGERKAALLKQMDDEFFKAIKGVYFPLARFGQYAVTVKGPDGKVESVSRAETKAEAEALRNNLLTAFPRDKGFTVGRVMLSKDFIADRDAVGRGFMTELYQVLDQQNMDAAQRAELEDTLGQLYLSSLPDLSWAKHGIHRKGTPGFSQDARRAFAQNMFHGARYLAKLRYSDLMQDELAAMQKHVDDWREVEDFDQNSAQRVVDEMNKRHESLMNPKSNPLSTALTSLGFVFHLGLSPASAMVNLSQTALVAYPIMGAKWGFGKASAALLKASAEAAKGKNDITASLNADELEAYNKAVRAGTIDVTMAHDLAGIAQGEDAGVMWKIRPVMRYASFLFHHAERFNRQVTFVAAYRLAREAGADHKAAFEQATKATYDGHFDYGAANRPRIMQGNVAKVLLLFKQYGQNMVYTLARNAQQAIKGESPEVREQALKALGGLLATHAMAAGVLGLPMVTTLLAAASMIGSDDDEPWDAKVALQNMLADAWGQKPAEVLAHGLSRLTPWDISGRVGLDKLIFPDVQEGLEGQRLGEAAMAAALGPVAGIGINVLKGLQDMSQGQYARGLESMMPAALRGPLKAIRYESEGALDKGGVAIKDEVSLAGVAGQLLGFSPSEVRLAQEGKSAIHQHDKALTGRREELLSKAARATRLKDAEARAEAMKEIERFNQKNPKLRITPLNVLQSVRNSQKRIDQAEGGVYLPKNRRDAMEAGRFAVVE